MAQNTEVNTWANSRGLLLCGVVIAPLFYTVVFIQAFTRTGYDVQRTPLSLLSLGDRGWIQIANFLVAGLLALFCAAGVRSVLASRRGGTWGPVFLVTFGLGLLLAGTFHPDPGYGFPPGVGAPAGMLPVMSRHASIHSAGFAVVILSVVLGSFVLARAFGARGERGISIYSAVNGVAVPVLLGIAIATNTTGMILIVGIVAFSWVSIAAWRLRVRLNGVTR